MLRISSRDTELGLGDGTQFVDTDLGNITTADDRDDDDDADKDDDNENDDDDDDDDNSGDNDDKVDVVISVLSWPARHYRVYWYSRVCLKTVSLSLSLPLFPRLCVCSRVCVCVSLILRLSSHTVHTPSQGAAYS